VIRRNLESLGLVERGRAVRAEVTRWLAGHAAEVAAATLVLLDPPYNDPVLDRALALLDPVVARETSVVAEHAHRQPLPPLRRLHPDRQRRYGDSAVSILTV
jgi:16S rRNA G966 N2-methylase RsmD